MHIRLMAAAFTATIGRPTAVLSAPVDTIVASEEFRGHLGLTIIKAQHAYGAGASGKGIVLH